MKRSRQGFTLIELLVVISIISVLISILLPALAAAREAGRSVQCLSNQRQVGVSFAVWQNDHKGYFPRYQATDLSDSEFNSNSSFKLTYGYAAWAEVMFRQRCFDTMEIFDCPTLNTVWPSVSLSEITHNTPLGDQYFRYIDYGYNYNNIGSARSDYYLGSGLAGHPRDPAQINEIRNPSQTYATMDNEVRSDARDIGYYLVEDTTAWTSYQYADARHKGALNVLWVDGHGSAVKIGDPVQPYSTGLTAYGDAGNYWDRR